MNHGEIKSFLASFQKVHGRTIVVIDFANVEKWKSGLSWKIGIQELARLVKHFSTGNTQLRRFYYGADYGPHEKSDTQTLWSAHMLGRAGGNGFYVVNKRVKYIHDSRTGFGYIKKCDLDVEMAVDLIKMKDDYDHIVLFSGDGDLVCALKYLKEFYSKTSYVFGARNYVGREIIDSVKTGTIKKVFYVEDFEYRLNMNRFRS